ncbi:MAG TPA: hypothetical protein VLK33_22905 [Terriglobales bacterium]|nr:hypothetical protein [Terriglobales bacterium]
MPMDKTKYPSNWDEISHRIRFERAGGKCEQCGLQNGLEIVRSDIDAAYFIVWNEEHFLYTYPDGEWIKMSEIPDEYDITRPTRVVLTVHHIGVDLPDGTPGSPHDKMDCRDENLIALCQRCHLLADLPHHIQARKRTLLDKKAAAIRESGQMELFDA